MSTLYVPLPVETVEQAAALPPDAIVVNDLGDRYNRLPRGDWHSIDSDRGLDEDLDAGGIAPPIITALVPVEADEDRRPRPGTVRTWGMSADDVAEQRRFVTVWEDA